MKTKAHFTEAFEVELYNVRVHVSVQLTLEAGLKKLTKHGFTKLEIPEDASALFVPGDPGHFGIFFTSKAITFNHVTHEVFHLTHRILHYIGANFDIEHEEQGAFLMSYLMDQVLVLLGNQGYVLIPGD